MRAIVPYAGRRFITGPRARMAYRVAYRAASNPAIRRFAASSAKSAAARIQRAFRNYSSRKRRSNGQTYNRVAWLVKDFEGRQFDTRTIYTNDLTKIARQQANDGQAMNISHRTSEEIRITGWKIEFQLRNDHTLHPVFVNFAVLKPKATDVISSSEFFRGNGQNRDLDFSTSLSGLEMMSMPLNTDKYWVLKRKRVMLAAVENGSSYFEHRRNNYTHFKWWIPYKRILRYDDERGGDVKCVTPIYLVFWLDDPFAVADTVAATDIITMNSQITSYFKNTQK